MLADHVLERRHHLWRWVTRAALAPLVRVSGEGELPATGPALLVANHVTLLDPLLVGWAVRRAVAWLATDTLTRHAVWGPVHRYLGAIPKARFRSDALALRAALKRLRAGGVVGVFPEGERTWTGRTAALQPGVAELARKTGAPVIAARLEGAWRCWPRHAPGPRRAEVRVVLRRVDPDEEAIAHALAADPRQGSLRRPGRLATGLSLVVFACPSCGGDRPIEDGDVLRCPCGASRRLDDAFLLDGAPLEDVIAATLARDLELRPDLEARIEVEGRAMPLRLRGERLVLGERELSTSHVRHTSVEFRHLLTLRLDEGPVTARVLEGSAWRIARRIAEAHKRNPEFAEARPEPS